MINLYQENIKHDLKVRNLELLQKVKASFTNLIKHASKNGKVMVGLYQNLKGN